MLSLAFLSAGTPLSAGSEPSVHKRPLSGVSPEQAAELIQALESAQQGLREGEFQPFILLAGSIASYEATEMSPREAFLAIRFSEVWSIERKASDTRLWQPFRLSYAPDGLGKLYWDIEVVLGFNDQIEQIALRYVPPAPF